MNLFIDTTSSYIILSLFDNDVKDSNIMETNRNQSEVFMEVLDTFLIKNNVHLNEIKHFYFACGPGSFTGIRVGLTFMKGLLVSGYTNINTIPSLYLLFDNFKDSNSIIDARGGKYYTQQVKDGTMQEAKLIECDNIDSSKYCTYDKELINIPSNVVRLVKNNYITSDFNGIYIKEAF
ncbi:MAG: tRNA (adenosine(37)-N6)-threonylcarbamoyltransferase complex dimerization subunit type 1 TsaB [Erysipelotrichales bacterium]